jgi:hypothetical protein
MATKKAKEPEVVITEEVALAKLEEITEATSLEAISQMPQMRRMMALSTAMSAARQYMMPLVPKMRELEGKGIGYDVDRPYPDEVICDALLEGVIKGAQPINGEITVISGKPYLTIRFFERAARELAGLTDLAVNFDIPEDFAKRKTVSVKSIATYRWMDQPRKYEEVFQVKVNSGMGWDAIRGKATRKLLRSVLESCLVGISFPDVDEKPEQVEASLKPRTLEERAANAVEQTASEAIDASEILAAELSLLISQAANFDELETVSTAISGASSSGELAPSGLKSLRAAYMVKVKEIESGG